MSILITGVAGFIGSNFARKLLNDGHKLVGIDNFCRGTKSNIEKLLHHPSFSFFELDLSNLGAYSDAMKVICGNESISEVWHFAANSDIPAGISDANVDLRDTFMTTFNTLELMRAYKIPIISFASTSAVYGDLGSRILKENIGPLFPISNYGAMKLASEALISSSLESWLKQAYIFRFPNVIGIPATHGVIFDFIVKLQKTPHNLIVLGDGTQRKSYLHVNDLMDAMCTVRKKSHERLNYFNIGADDTGISVREIAEMVVQKVSFGASITFGIGNKGWVGDVPSFFYSIEKLKSIGWKPSMDSAAAIKFAVSQIAAQLTKRHNDSN